MKEFRTFAGSQLLTLVTIVQPQANTAHLLVGLAASSTSKSNLLKQLF